MKKLFALLMIAGMFSLVACGPSAEEKQKQDDAAKMSADSAATAQAAASAAASASSAAASADTAAKSATMATDTTKK